MTTTFVSPVELRARVPTAVTAAVGSHPVQVRHESGNRSNAVALTVFLPPPRLTELLPRIAEQGSANALLLVRGDNFDATCKVFIDGSAVATTFVGIQ